MASDVRSEPIRCRCGAPLIGRAYTAPRAGQGREFGCSDTGNAYHGAVAAAIREFPELPSGIVEVLVGFDAGRRFLARMRNLEAALGAVAAIDWDAYEAWAGRHDAENRAAGVTDREPQPLDWLEELAREALREDRA